MTSLDQAEVVFTRKPETLDPKLLQKLAGVYLTPSKVKIEVHYQPGAGLSLVFPGGPPRKLVPVKGLQGSRHAGHVPLDATLPISATFQYTEPAVQCVFYQGEFTFDKLGSAPEEES